MPPGAGWGQPVGAPPPGGGKRRRKLPWILLGLVAVAAAVGGFFLLSGDDDDDGDDASDTTEATADDTGSDDTGDTDTSDGGDDTSDTTGGSAEGLSPTELVEEYFAALESGDCETLIEYVTEETWSNGGEDTREEALTKCETDQGSAPGLALDDVELVEGGEEGDEAATLDVTVTSEGETQTTTVEAVMEDGAWKLDFYEGV